jgi:outer membrane lipoprotein-sorting protein
VTVGSAACGRVGRGLSFLPAVLLLVGLASACASVALVPPPDVVDRARAATTYSATMRVDLRGAEIRGRARVFLGFRRPDALRLELPGPTGPRLVVVAQEGTLVAVFPAERAVFKAPATAPEMESLFGIALTPAELADLLVGQGPARLERYEALWGRVLPREVRATFPGGARLAAKIEEADMNPTFPAAAFEAPPHEGFRVVDAKEARQLWLR